MKRSTVKDSDKPRLLMERLKEKIIALGGTVPEPWPWAISRQWKRKGGGVKIEVDAALYNLQLLELKEDLEKKATAASIRDTSVQTLLERAKQ